MQPIRRAYEQLQRFTADASHELRAPLAAIQCSSRVNVPGQRWLTATSALENIVEITKSMSALISNLLFLARHEGALAPEGLKPLTLLVCCSHWRIYCTNNCTELKFCHSSAIAASELMC